MDLNVHCHILLGQMNTDLDSWDSVGAKKWCHMSRLDQGLQRYWLGLEMGPSAHCRILLRKTTSDLDPWYSVDVKNGVTCQDWTKNTRDINKILKFGSVVVVATTKSCFFKVDHKDWILLTSLPWAERTSRMEDVHSIIRDINPNAEM